MKFNHSALRIIFYLFMFFAGTGCAAQHAAGDSSRKKKSTETGYTLTGKASFYADKFQGRRTATGEVFSQKKLTAACNSLPLGTWVQVSNLKNGKIVVVKTNDRLAKNSKRVIDLTHAAAVKLGFISEGTTRVKIVVLDQSLYNK